MKLLAGGHLYAHNMFATCQGLMIQPKNGIKKLPASVTMRINLKVVNFKTLHRAYFIFKIMKFLALDFLYVHKMCGKFQGQKISTQKIFEFYLHVLFRKMISLHPCETLPTK